MFSENFKILHIGAIESNMAHGPVYFKCFPDLELSYIDDLFIQKALTLNIQTKGYDMDPRAKNILIVYLIYYKAMTTAVDAKCLVKPKKGMTLLFQANEEHSSVMTPNQSHMIIMIIWTPGTLLFIFVPLITYGSSIGGMKLKIKMIFQIGSKNGGYSLVPLRTFFVLKSRQHNKHKGKKKLIKVN